MRHLIVRVHAQVLRFFRNMGLPHPERAPMMLVDAFTLNEYSDKEGKDIRSGGPVFHVRGLTLATVYKHHSIPSIVRAAGSGSGLGVSSVVMPLQPSVTCSVSAVLVMFGLPRLLTGAPPGAGGARPRLPVRNRSLVHTQPPLTAPAPRPASRCWLAAAAAAQAPSLRTS